MKDNLNQQIINISKYVLGLLGFALCVWLLASGYPESDAKLSEINEFVKDSPASFFAVDYVMYVIGFTLIAVIGFFLYQLVIRPKQTIVSILGLLISALIFMVFFFIGSSETWETLQVEPDKIGANTIAITSAGIYTVGICLIVGVTAIVVGPLMGRYRK